MNSAHLRNVDLNLLLIFDAIMTDRSVSQAARRLVLTQSAASHALSRLRTMIGDELFVRGPDGMMPTPRAVELAIPVRDALEQIRAALGPKKFEPRHSTNTFRFAMTDYFAAIALSKLVSRLEREAPGVDIRIVPNLIVNAPAMLETQEIDFAIGLFRNRFRKLPKRFSSVTLFEDSYSCVMRRGHPLTRKRMTLADFVSARHLQLALSGEELGMIDQILRRQHAKRRIALTIGHYLAAPPVIQASDMIMTVSTRMAQLYSQHFGLVFIPTPIALPAAPSQLVWYGRSGNHAANNWMRQIILDVCSRL